MLLTVFNTSNIITDVKAKKKHKSRREFLKVKQPESNQTEKLSDEEAKLVKNLLHYPSLEKVFDNTNVQNLPALKQKMQFTIDDLERVIRRGTNYDAGKAAKVLEAYKIVLSFLDELDKARKI